MACCKSQGNEQNTSNKVPRIRNITDAPCLFFFSLFWCFILVVAVFSFTFGEPKRLAHGYDSFGNVCGSTNLKLSGSMELSGQDMTDRPYIFYFNGLNLKKSLRICVKSCPSVNINNLMELKYYYKSSQLNLCRYDFDVLNSSSEDISHGLNESLTVSSPYGPCPVFPIRKTENILNRCLPSDYPGTIQDVLSKEDIGQLLLLDIYTTWPAIITFFFSALVGAFALMSLFYLTTIFTSYLVLVAVTSVSILSVVLLWWKYCEFASIDYLPYDCCQSNGVLLACAIIATLFTVVVLGLTVYLRYRVSFLKVLFQESAECLKALPAIYLQPVITFIFLSLFYVCWIFMMSYLSSSRYPETSVIKPNYNFDQFYVSNLSVIDNNMERNLSEKNITIEKLKRFTQVEFNQGPWMLHVWWICLLALIWISEFALACQQMTVAGAVARWYFGGKSVSEKNPVWTSLRYLILYHMGSAALGSLLISLLKLPRLIVGFFYSKYRNGVSTNFCTNCGYSFCVHFFDCYENFLAFINHNAYTVVEMQGVNFLTAGKRSWIININNNLMVGRDNAAANIVMFLSKVFVTITVSSIAFLFFLSNDKVYSPILPTLLVCVCSFFISHCVISVFDLSLDTLYLCLCEDQDINEDDGIWRQSPLVPAEVRATLQTSNKPSTSSTFN